MPRTVPAATLLVEVLPVNKAYARSRTEDETCNLRVDLQDREGHLPTGCALVHLDEWKGQLTGALVCMG